MTDREALDYIKNHGVWHFAAIHGWTKPDEKLIESFKTITNSLTDFEWLKSKINFTFLDSLEDAEDKLRIMNILGIRYDK